MKPVLVKIDVAVADTGRSVGALFAMADGGTRLNQALEWVFDFSTPGRHKRELRFWRPELEARGGSDPKKCWQYSGMELEAVLKRIVPETHRGYRASEVSELFQIRHNTRVKLLGGGGKAGRPTVYARRTLAEFLRQRWLGALRRPSARGGFADGPRATRLGAATRAARVIDL